MRGRVQIREQLSPGGVFLLLRNEGKALLAEELEKEAARIDRAEREDVVRQRDKGQAFSFRLANEALLYGLGVECEKPFHVLEVW